MRPAGVSSGRIILISLAVMRSLGPSRREMVGSSPVGSAQNAAGNNDFIVRAHDAKTGRLLWQDLVDVAGGDDAATAVVLHDDRVFVVGRGMDATGGHRLLLRAYNAKSGELAWEDRSPLATVDGLAMAEPMSWWSERRRTSPAILD